MNINELFPLFASLVGFPAFLASAINALKYFGILADGLATKVVFWGNVVGFLAIAFAYFTGNVPIISQIDAQLGNFALFMISFVAFISQLGLAKMYHAGLRGTPVIGTSYSLEAQEPF